MTFYFSKIADYGTSNPICARIGSGLSEIVNLTTLSNKDKEKGNAILHDLSNNLIIAEQRATELVRELDEIEDRISGRAKTQTKSTVPNTIDSSLKLHLARDFLKYTNNSLRLLTGFFDVCLGIGNKQTKLHHVVKALHDLEPAPEALLDHLLRTAPWYKQIIDLRGTDEHKEAHKSFVENYTIKSDGKSSYLQRPRFNDGTDITSFLKTSLNYLLPFFELALVFTLSYLLPNPVAIVEIPEDQRNPTYPRRFRLDLA